ncbi:MAG: hypothetical protein K0R21_343 [Anaerocolumna sp.]|jgi:signal transduction histidine kinase|nr:hypothetical protein [Anaerocolumna sp.]
MKYKILEDIRQILRKIILPLRRKKEEWLGNFRFSILFRISLHYMKLLVISGIAFMAVFSVLYYVSEWRECNHRAELLLDEFQTIATANLGTDYLPQAERNVELEINKSYFVNFNPYNKDGITLKIIDSKNIEIYNDITFDISLKKKYFNKLFYEERQGEQSNIFILYDEKEVTIDSNNYTFIFQYDLSDRGSSLVWLLGAMIVLYVLLILYIMRNGQKKDQGLFQPIYDMSTLANRLNVNNLHSERINVEGTKNELKDLASVINSMLDRIETSYESQKQFVSDASHELRTPIAVIQGYANLLKRWGTKDEEILQESIEAINNESKAMQDLVEKLLFLSRHDKKTLKLEKTRFNMCQVVEDMVKETKLVTTNRITTSPILENVVVYGDKQALKQAIRVFIDNAVKYTKDGDTITICCKNQNGDCIISVQDTGIGMTRKDVEHIFERFYRSDQVRNDKIYGHGLGLSIAKLIILAHTGRIKVRSQFTKGTTFTITLPRRRH